MALVRQALSSTSANARFDLKELQSLSSDPIKQSMTDWLETQYYRLHSIEYVLAIWAHFR